MAIYLLPLDSNEIYVNSKMCKYVGSYTVLHINRRVLVWAENQGNHQNFEKSLLPYKLSLILIAVKQKKIFFFEGKNSKWRTKKKLIFQLRQFSIFFCENFMDWSFR